MKQLFTSTLFSIALLTLLYACGGKTDSETEVTIPANILNEEAFARVLADFALAEGASNINVKGTPIRQLDTVYAFNPFTDNGLTKAKYDSTVLFYAQHTELYKKVYENVLAILSEMQTRRDSLRKDSVSK